MKVAILVDGGFYRKVAKHFCGDKTPENRANELINYCKWHYKSTTYENKSLYRIFYYDCPPISKQIYHPLTQQSIDLAKSPIYTWTNEFFSALKEKRKVALRLGVLAEEFAYYGLTAEATRKLFNQKKEIKDLTIKDFDLNIRQKGVDMKIGIDIASLAFKKQVEQIVLISGDSDFVPVAKLARREGIDFIVDSMGQRIKEDLAEHIDGFKSYYRTLKREKNEDKDKQ